MILNLFFSATVLFQLEDLRFQETGEFGGVVYLGEQQTMEAKFYVSIYSLHELILVYIFLNNFLCLSFYIIYLDIEFYFIEYFSFILKHFHLRSLLKS